MLVLSQKAETTMQLLDKNLKSYKFQLDMVKSKDSKVVPQLQEDYKLFQQSQNQCRQAYFMMEEKMNQIKTQDTIGSGGRVNTILSDDYIRDKHIDNINLMRAGDGKIADIMRLGNEAV